MSMKSKDLVQKMTEQYLITSSSKRLGGAEDEYEMFVIVYEIADRLRHAFKMNDVIHLNNVLSLFITSYLKDDLKRIETIRKVLNPH